MYMIYSNLVLLWIWEFWNCLVEITVKIPLIENSIFSEIQIVGFTINTQTQRLLTKQEIS